MRGFWLGMTVHLWQTTLVLVALLLLDGMMRRAPARHRHLLWSAGLAKLLVPFPLLAWLWPGLVDVGSMFGRDEVVSTALVTLGRIAQPSVLIEVSGPASDPVSGAWPFALLTMVWGAGVTFLLLRRWLRRHPSTPGREPWNAPAPRLDKIERAASLAGVSLARLRIADEPVVPCLHRLLRPLVVLPRVAVDALEPEELRAILLHEEAHRARRDLWLDALQTLATGLFFFYPPVWWLSRRLRQTAEMACDEAVLGAGVDAPSYARALARTVQLGLLPTTASAFTGSRGSPMRERLARLRSPERYVPMTRHKFCVSGAFALALVFSLAPFAGAGNLAIPPGVPTAVPTPPSDQVLETGEQGTQLAKLAAAQRQVSLSVRQQAIGEVIERVAELGGFTVSWEGRKPATPISVVVSNTPVHEVLTLVAEGQNLQYEVTDPSTLVVRYSPYNIIRREAGAEGEEDLYVRVGGDIQEPEKIFHVSPEYPEEARRAKMEGVVLLEAVIDKEGNVGSTRVLRSLSSELDAAATTAVEQWKYTPTHYNGEPVEVIVTITVQFHLIQ